MKFVENATRGEFTGESFTAFDDDIVIVHECDSIDDYAFAHSNVRKAVIDVPVIGKGAFYNCQKLEEVIFSDKVIAVQDESFFQCMSLKRLIFPKRLVTIGRSAFEKCTSLEAIEIPERLERISKEAFQYCISLLEVCFNSNLRALEENAFAYSGVRYVDFSGAFVGVRDESANAVVDIKQKQGGLLETKNCLLIDKHPFLGCAVKFKNFKPVCYNKETANYEKSSPLTRNLLETILKEDSIGANLARRMIFGEKS